jgi:hypothetical protein
MRTRIFLLVCALAGCGGSTNTGLFGGGGDASVSSDGGASDGGSTGDSGPTVTDAGAAGACFDKTGNLLTSMKKCAAPIDCKILAHTDSCCGSLLYVGVSAGKAAQFAVCEEAWDKSLPACGCAAGPPRAEDGNEVQGQADVVVECVDVQGGLGVCRTKKK